MTTVVIDVTAGKRDGLDALEAAAATSLDTTATTLVLIGDETDVTAALASTPPTLAPAPPVFASALPARAMPKRVQPPRRATTRLRRADRAGVPVPSGSERIRVVRP